MNSIVISIVAHSHWYDGFVDGSFFERAAILLFFVLMGTCVVRLWKFGFYHQGSVGRLVGVALGALVSTVVVAVMRWPHVPIYEDSYRDKKLLEAYGPLVCGLVTCLCTIGIALTFQFLRWRSERRGPCKDQ